jgi:hypothetical protein
MQPFETYPYRGRSLLSQVVGSNCRHGYGRKFMQITGQRCCAYCGIDFTASYTNWLQMAIDHVVPKSVCIEFGLSPEWYEDCSNKVLACAACNGFYNRFKPSTEVACPVTLEQFFDLRDQIFNERKGPILQKHIDEKDFFDSKPWNMQS